MKIVNNFSGINFRLGITALTFAAFFACSPSVTREKLEEPLSEGGEDGYLNIISEELSPEESLKRLELYLSENPNERHIFEDIKALLLAEIASNESQESETTNKKLNLWSQAMSSETSLEFSKIAFEGWLRAYAESTKKILEPSIMTQLILAETQQGKKSIYMREKKLTSHKRLLPVLRKNIPNWLSSSISAEALIAPNGIPSNDPLLIETAKMNCQVQSLDTSSWTKWSISLPRDVREYFYALVLQCQKKNNELMEKFSSLAQRLRSSTATEPFALEALSRLASMQRNAGMRREAAETYVDLIEVWDKGSIQPETLGLNHFEFYKKKINDLLWASRYRAMIADYENSKIYAQKAIADSQSALKAVKNLSISERNDLSDLKAEAYHTLASRVAVEKRQWESAASLNLMGLESSNISAEWRFRLLWLAGLYEYIAGNYAKAKFHWETCLHESIETAQTPMTLFWLGMAESKLQRQKNAQEYFNQLFQKFPLSYYSTIAPNIAKIKSPKELHSHLISVFGNPDEMRKSILSKKGLSVVQPREIIAKNSKFKQAIIRAETINKLGNKALMLTVASEFESNLKQLIEGRALTPTEEEAASVYSSRLFYVSEKFLNTIGTTHKISLKNLSFWQLWPEQIHVFFPRPYIEHYIDASREFMIDPETLLAISRQESAFTTAIESPAGALGVMQLMRQTAQKYASMMNIETGDIDSLLSEPKNNIKIGAKYLATLTEHYKSYTPAIYAGYNAGENAVDLWLKSRAHSDPLIFVELIPFGETKDYVKNVWRNKSIYLFLNQSHKQQKLGRL
jgi:soluble lytic murein transglycosylase-like protein/TolA-binding protein